MKRIAIILAVLMAVAAAAHAAEFYRLTYRDHVMEGNPSDLRAVKKMLDESLVPARVVTKEYVTRLDGEFPIDPDIRSTDAIVKFISRHRAAFGLIDPENELGVQLERASKVPFDTVKRGEQAMEAVFVQFIPRESSLARMWVYTVADRIVRIESDIVPTYDYDYLPSISPYEALDKAMYELDGEEEDHYTDDMRVSLMRGILDGEFISYYSVGFRSDEYIITVRVHADTGKVMDLERRKPEAEEE